MEFINTRKAPAAIGPYSQAVKVGNILFVSGQIPINAETGKIQRGNIEDLTKLVLKNLENIVLASDYKKENIAKITIFLKNIQNFETVNQVYSEFFKTHKPARAVVEVSNLPKNADIEIDAICVK
jgi:2-iminobutanoate/2-iminopropanoate deaminase